MWNDYSKSFIKNNKSMSRSIRTSALMAALFLSLLCTLFYNFWSYDIEKIKLEDGDWQGRIVGEFTQEDIETIRHIANMKEVIINQELSKEKQVIDLYFTNERRIYSDMPLIIKHLGLSVEEAQYHDLLLSRYFIHDPNDKEPPLLLGFMS